MKSLFKTMLAAGIVLLSVTTNYPVTTPEWTQVQDVPGYENQKNRLKQYKKEVKQEKQQRQAKLTALHALRTQLTENSLRTELLKTAIVDALKRPMPPDKRQQEKIALVNLTAEIKKDRHTHNQNLLIIRETEEAIALLSTERERANSALKALREIAQENAPLVYQSFARNL